MQTLGRLRITRGVTIALAIAVACFGQFETATVLGTVVDANGAAMPQARVILESVDTGIRQNISTSAEGTYQFLEVRIGNYRVQAEAVGFKKLETPVFRVDVGARQRVDVKLQVGDVAETIQVEATASSVEPDSSDRGQVVNREAVVN